MSKLRLGTMLLHFTLKYPTFIEGSTSQLTFELSLLANITGERTVSANINRFKKENILNITSFT